jgi:peptide/nickel transport system permease protein
MFFVVIQWQWLPYPSYVSPFEDPVAFLQTMILPWIVLAILYAAFYMRLTRNQVLEVLDDDYVRTARAKGLPERTVVVKHALRAGLTPIVTAAGLDLAGLLGGAIISENIFSLPGMGALASTRSRSRTSR